MLPFFVLIEFVEVPALAYLLIWFGWQLFSGLQSRAFHSLAGGVAWWAHIGGFLFGIAAAPLLARKEPPKARGGTAGRVTQGGSLDRGRDPRPPFNPSQDRRQLTIQSGSAPN